MGKKSEAAETPRKGTSVRMRDDLKNNLERSAANNNRTVGSEIEHRLDASFKFDLVGGQSDSGGMSSIKDIPAAVNLLSGISGVISQVSRISHERRFTELQMRIAAQSAIDTIVFFELWSGGNDLPELLQDISIEGTKKRDLPPAHLGRELALDYLIWESAWRDRPVYDDALEGRIANHWTGDGSVVEVGPDRDKASK